MYAVLERSWAPLKPIVVRTRGAVTFATAWPRRLVQVVLRLYTSPAEVLMGFDVDSCCACYDGRRVLCLPRFRRAVSGAYNLADPSRRSASYELRLHKYALRGFAVCVPGFDAARVDAKIFLGDGASTEGLARLLWLVNEDAAAPTFVPHAFSHLRSRLSDGSAADGVRKSKLARTPASRYAGSDEGDAHMFHWLPGQENEGYNSPGASLNAYMRHLAKDRDVGATLPFLATLSIEDALKWPPGKALAVLPGDAHYHTTMARRTLEEKKPTPAVHGVVQFLTHDPMRQYITGSFDPDDRDWFAMAYGETDAPPAGPAGPAPVFVFT